MDFASNGGHLTSGLGTWCNYWWSQIRSDIEWGYWLDLIFFLRSDVYFHPDPPRTFWKRNTSNETSPKRQETLKYHPAIIAIPPPQTKTARWENSPKLGNAGNSRGPKRPLDGSHFHWISSPATWTSSRWEGSNWWKVVEILRLPCQAINAHTISMLELLAHGQRSFFSLMVGGKFWMFQQRNPWQTEAEMFSAGLKEKHTFWKFVNWVRSGCELKTLLGIIQWSLYTYVYLHRHESWLDVPFGSTKKFMDRLSCWVSCWIGAMLW